MLNETLLGPCAFNPSVVPSEASSCKIKQHVARESIWFMNGFTPAQGCTRSNSSISPWKSLGKSGAIPFIIRIVLAGLSGTHFIHGILLRVTTELIQREFIVNHPSEVACFYNHIFRRVSTNSCNPVIADAVMSVKNYVATVEVHMISEAL